MYKPNPYFKFCNFKNAGFSATFGSFVPQSFQIAQNKEKSLK
jgi:hypothetical protein